MGRPLDKNGRWQGGRFYDKSGYVLVKALTHPNANNGGYVREHRLVMERVLGRLLTRDELVHHKNGIKDDNRPENLEVLSHAAHQREERLGKRFKYGTRVERICHQCGKPFYLQPSRAKRIRHFCSRACWKAFFAAGGTLAQLQS